MTSARQRLTGHITVDLPPSEAFRLFTARGERDWAHGWHPRFPVPVADDAEPGTVFETDAHGQHTIWLVTRCEPGKRISYARLTPGHQVGNVTVTLSPSNGHSEVEVTYDLTALSPNTVPELDEFADGYSAYLQSWQNAIASWLSGHQPLSHGDH